MTLWVWDLNQLEKVYVNISDIGYCMCLQNLGIMTRFSTCYMMSQAEVQSQWRMYGAKLVIFEIQCNECTVNGR